MSQTGRDNLVIDLLSVNRREFVDNKVAIIWRTLRFGPDGKIVISAFTPSAETSQRAKWMLSTMPIASTLLRALCFEAMEMMLSDKWPAA